MSTAFPFIQNHDIVQCFNNRYDFGSDAAYSDVGEIVTLENTDHVAVLIDVIDIDSDATPNLRLKFESCMCDGSDSQVIAPIYYREKVNDGSDTWGAYQTVTDGYFEFSDGAECPALSTYHQFIIEFDAAQIQQEGIGGGTGSDANNCIRAVACQNQADGSDVMFRAHYILHPLRYSNPASTSHDNYC